MFIDDFSVVGASFDKCLDNLELVLKRCEEINGKGGHDVGTSNFRKRY